MKKVLFSLMLLAIYASANTCTEAMFAQQANFLSYSQNAPHLDSVYIVRTFVFSDSTEKQEERYVKLSYNNGYLEKIINGYVGDIDNILTDVDHIYASKDESVLSKTGLEGLISDSTVGDTTFWIRKHYQDGILNQAMYYKITESYSSCMDSTFDGIVAVAGMSRDLSISSVFLFIWDQLSIAPLVRPMNMFSATVRFGHSVIS